MKKFSNDTLREALEELWPTDSDGNPVSEEIFDAIVVAIESRNLGLEGADAEKREAERAWERVW